MKCARAIELFSSYAENAMEAPLRLAFEQHLAECEECKGAYESFNATLMVLEEMPEMEVPAGFHAAVMARIDRAMQANPHPVRWWHLDWGRVFTVRVPARALAVGFAALLLLVVLVQLTPTHTIRGFFGLPSTQGPVADTRNFDLPKPPSGAPGACVISQSGLSICVDTSAAGTSTGSYALHLDAKGELAIEYEVDLMPANATTPDAEGEVYHRGYVRAKQGAAVGVAVGESTVARVAWPNGSRSCKEYVFLPSGFSSEAGPKMIAIENTSVYEALKQVSETYGVVVLASGDLSKTVNYAGGRSLDPQDAVYGVARAAGLRWVGKSSGVYVVEPGS